MSTIYKRLLKDSASTSAGLMYGVINSVMLIPVTISFCSIIYRDKGFEQYLPQLVKLVLFSSMIHQLAFTYFSTLPFAIGQVQDAGLIFLSSMAADIVQGCTRSEQIVPTTVVILPLCTFLLGCMLVVVAKLKLATIIQYLPMPVIGGYLAFIGFFCGQAGLAMMAGVQVVSILDWGNFYSERALILLAPGVILGVTTYLLLCQVRSPYVLPCCMLGILTIFFGLLFLFGMSLEDARAYGWIAPLSHPEPFYESWALYDFSLVDWSQFPQQSLRLIGMFLVVAFSSSLDVAAIEMEMGLPLDYNRELNTVGLANVFSGLTGGYTGSYIFSQTIFTMRRGVYSRVNGYTVVLCEALMIMLPISIISYLPKLFFGSLLILISTDLMMEWLVAARHKMAPMEFAVCVLTFVAIQATGIEVGMFIGILLAMASFVVSYSSAQAVSSAALQTSTVIRTFEERACLIAHRGKIVTITLKGYIFFGSAVKILEDVKSHVTISVPDLSPQQLMQQQQEKATAATQKAAASAAAKINAEHPPTESTSLLQQRNSGDYDPRYGAQAGQFSADSLRNEGRKMSFRLGSKSRSPEPSPGKKPNVADSAVKKLFPDVSAPATGSVGESDSEFSPAALLGQPHSASMLIRTTSSAAAATHSGSYAASVSVYDMSPETLQRVIEERQLERGAESYGVFSSAREVCYGGAQQGSGPLAAPAHGVSRISQPLTIAHQHSGSNLRDLSFLPVTTATSAARAAPDASGVATEPAVDIEMGRPRAGSQGRSLLTEKLEELDASPRAAPTGNNANVNVDPLSAEIMQHEQLQQQDQAPAKKEGPRQQMPLRRQSGQTKVPASATATLAASFENAGLVDSMHSSRQSSIGSLRRGSSSEVNSSEQFPRKPSPGVAEESLLSVVFDHQRRRRAGSGEASRRILLSPSQHPHQQQRNRGAQRDVPTPYQVANALASLQGETIEGILRSRENSVDMTHSDREMPEMKRERSVHDIQPASCSRMTGLDKMHSPSVPCPEQVLSHIPSVQKLTQEMNRAAAGARDWADSAEENGDVMTEYLVLDFAAVVGVDATATRSCFLMMVQLMRSANVTVVFANMSASLEALFRVHKVIGVQDVVIPLLDDALEWCEERVLLSAGHLRRNDSTVSSDTHQQRASHAAVDASYPELERNHTFYSRASQKRQQVVAGRSRNNIADAAEEYTSGTCSDGHHSATSRSGVPPVPPVPVMLTADPLRRILEDYLEVDSSANPRLQQLLNAGLLARYFRRTVFPELEVLYDTHQTAHKIYFIESGEVEIVVVTPTELGGIRSAPLENSPKTSSGVSEEAPVSVVRINKVHAGGAFGEADFLLGRTHSAQAHTMVRSVLWTLDREHYARMEVEAPSLCLLIQHSLLKSLAIASTCALYAQHPTAAAYFG